MKDFTIYVVLHVVVMEISQDSAPSKLHRRKMKEKKTVNIIETIPTTVVDLFVALIMGSVIEIMGTTVTNINPDKGEDWLVVKRKIGNLPTIKLLMLMIWIIRKEKQGMHINLVWDLLFVFNLMI